MLNPRGLFVVLVAVLGFLTGCSEPASEQSAAPPEPNADVKVLQVDQLDKMDTKKADGQFVVVKLIFKNISKQDINLTGTDFKVKFIAQEEKEDQYEQGVESGLTEHFENTYGHEAKEQVIEQTTYLTVHPGLEMQRYAIFLLPSAARLEDYVLRYVPPSSEGDMFGGGAVASSPPIEVKLQDADTQVNDKRELQ